jgi:hypothetical protein
MADCAQMNVDTAEQLLEYAQPLIDDADDSIAHLDQALGLATLFWTLALNEDELAWRREVEALASELHPASETTRCEFRHMAHVMVQRHRSMFPELHGRAPTRVWLH